MSAANIEMVAGANLQGLPDTVNPILTFREGMIGMTCMGLGRDTMRGSHQAPLTTKS
jgi:hypothetical protein